MKLKNTFLAILFIYLLNKLYEYKYTILSLILLFFTTIISINISMIQSLSDIEKLKYYEELFYLKLELLFCVFLGILLFIIYSLEKSPIIEDFEI